MQSIPALLAKRDVIACAPTGSGKSGAFIIPALIWAGFDLDPTVKRRGLIKTLLLTPTRELATQIHREVTRLGTNKPGGLTAVLLSKNNAHLAATNCLGGDKGVDCLVTTPMRLCGVLNMQDSKLNLGQVRLIALDEADRLLDKGDVADAAHEDEQTSASFVSQIDQILTATPATTIRALFSATMGPNVRELASTVSYVEGYMMIQ